MRSAETGVKNSSRLKSGWMIFDGEGSLCDRACQSRHSSRWRDGRAHWHGSLHNVANERCSLDSLLPATLSDLELAFTSEASSFLARSSLLHY